MSMYVSDVSNPNPNPAPFGSDLCFAIPEDESNVNSALASLQSDINITAQPINAAQQALTTFRDEAKSDTTAQYIEKSTDSTTGLSSAITAASSKLQGYVNQANADIAKGRAVFQNVQLQTAITQGLNCGITLLDLSHLTG